MIETEKIIGGIMTISNKLCDYIYYDDYNEIVDRLRLIITSQLAGNDDHTNEII